MTTAPVRPGPTTTSGGPVQPTVEQLLILVARAERKGALDHAEGNRLRAGILHLAGQHFCDPGQTAKDAALRRKYDNARKNAWRWKQNATRARTADASPSVTEPVDDRSRDALRRVVELATRWTHIPAKRQAGASVLAAIRNDDSA